jgi:hypothetical protein
LSEIEKEAVKIGYDPQKQEILRTQLDNLETLKLPKGKLDELSG